MEIAILGFCFIYLPIKYLIDFELFLEHNPGNFEKRVLSIKSTELSERKAGNIQNPNPKIKKLI